MVKKAAYEKEEIENKNKKTKVYAVLTKPENRCGVEAAKQLAQKPNTKRVYFCYFSTHKLQRVVNELQVSENFQFLPYESPDQFETALPPDTIIDGILINKHGCNSHNDGRGEQNEFGLLPFAQYKLVDNANLINRFLRNGKLTKGSRVIISGSEAARGVKSMGFPVPVFEESVDSFVSYLDGTGFDKHDANMGYSYHMAISALMVNALARHNPSIYFSSVSPGFTRDSLRPSNVAGVPSFVYVVQFVLSLIFPVLKVFRVGHRCNVAADRFVKAVAGSDDWTYPSGTPVGALKGVSGTLGDMTIHPNGEQLGNTKLQDWALDAVSRYMEEDWKFL